MLARTNSVKTLKQYLNPKNYLFIDDNTLNVSYLSPKRTPASSNDAGLTCGNNLWIRRR